MKREPKIRIEKSVNRLNEWKLIVTIKLEELNNILWGRDRQLEVVGGESKNYTQRKSIMDE